MTWLQGAGSIASILGLIFTAYVFIREKRIETEVLDLTAQEKKRHDQSN